MKRNWRLLVVISSLLLLMGCGISSKEVVKLQEQEKEEVVRDTSIENDINETFYFIIEDVFELIDVDGVVVVGVNENSMMYTNTKVDVLSSEGRISTVIEGIETYDAGMVDYVEEGSSVGILLSGLSKEDVSKGDIIVLPGEGDISKEIFALMGISDEITEDEVKALIGETIQVYFLNEPIDAMVSDVILPEELGEEQSEEMNIAYVVVTFSENVAYGDEQLIKFYKGDTYLGIGYVFIDK